MSAGGRMTGADPPDYVFPRPEDSPFVEVGRLVRALRRRRKVWLATAFLGLLGGVAALIEVPQPYTATTTLLLKYSLSTDPTRGMATDVQVASSDSVARRAAVRLGPPESADQLRAAYTSTSVTDNLLKITATATTADGAVKRADAAAAAFLDVRREQYDGDLQALLQVFKSRVDSLNTQVQHVNASIDGFPASDPTRDPGARSQQLSLLLSQRASITQQVQDLETRIEDATAQTTTIESGSHILDPSVLGAHSRVRSIATDLALGAVLGGGVGAGAVVLLEILSRRVRRREEVAMALGAPVAVSLGPLRGSPRSLRRHLRNHLRAPQPDITRVVNHLRASLPATVAPPPALMVVSLGADGAAAVAVAALAAELSQDGTEILVVDMTARRVLAAVVGVKAGTATRVTMAKKKMNIWLAFPTADVLGSPDDDTARQELAELRERAGVILGIADVDLQRDAGHLRQWAGTAVAFVAAGRMTSSGLNSAGRVLRAAGLHINSAVLVGADPHDDTVGLGAGPREDAELRATSLAR